MMSCGLYTTSALVLRTELAAASLGCVQRIALQVADAICQLALR
jgi:hypothetical protein